jgi:hypothetical protein
MCRDINIHLSRSTSVETDSKSRNPTCRSRSSYTYTTNRVLSIHMYWLLDLGIPRYTFHVGTESRSLRFYFFRDLDLSTTGRQEWGFKP